MVGTVPGFGDLMMNGRDSPCSHRAYTLMGAVNQIPSRQLNNHDDLAYGKFYEDSKTESL